MHSVGQQIKSTLLKSLVHPTIYMDEAQELASMMDREASSVRFAL